MTQKTTILKEVQVTYGGYQISAFGAGTFVTIEYDEDQIEIVKGVGHATALIKDNSTFMVKVNVQASADSGAYLKKFYTAVKRSGQGLPLSVVDNSPGSAMSFYAPIAFINRLPNLEISDTVNNQEWVFVGSDYDYNVGGKS
jgi:hypothetical protein